MNIGLAIGLLPSGNNRLFGPKLAQIYNSLRGQLTAVSERRSSLNKTWYKIHGVIVAYLMYAYDMSRIIDFHVCSFLMKTKKMQGAHYVPEKFDWQYNY